MLGLFTGLKSYVHLGKKIGACEVEGPVARLNYRVTSLILLGCCVLVTALEWVGNGSKIACVQDGVEDDWTVPANVINTYCYIMTTFTLPKHMSGKAGVNVVQPGVGPYRVKDDEVKYKAYYQWVPFVLLLQAIVFYVPHLMVKSCEGGKVNGIISGLNSIIIDKDERVQKQKILTEYFMDNLNSHNVWAIKIFLCEAFSFFVIVMNIYFIDVFFDGEFSTYGIRVAEMIGQEPETRIDPMSQVFPRMTKCTFHKYGPTGTLQHIDSLCMLPINIINEKIYVFLWFWLVILCIITGLSVIYHLFLMVSPSMRNMLLRSQATRQKKLLINFHNITPHLQVGDWKLLHMLCSNMEPRVFGEFVLELAVQMKEQRNETEEAANNPLLAASL